MKILVDSDFLVGFFLTGDAHHQKTKLIYQDTAVGNRLFISNLVIQETATVLSHLVSMETARMFKQKLSKLNLTEIKIDQKMEDLAWQFFLTQTKKGSSFVDCSNLAIMQVLGVDKVLSFDKFYPNEFKL